MIINVTESLKIFLEERKERFLEVSKKQQKEWVKAIEDNIAMSLEDNDIFYDHMPEDVEEI